MRHGDGAPSRRVIVSVTVGLLIAVSLLPAAAQADDHEPAEVYFEFACNAHDILCGLGDTVWGSGQYSVCVEASVLREPQNWVITTALNYEASTAYNWCRVSLGGTPVPYLTVAGRGEVDGISQTINPGCPVGNHVDTVHLVQSDGSVPAENTDGEISPLISQCPAKVRITVDSVTVEESQWWPCPP